MSTAPTTVEKLRGLPWSFATNATNTVFVQFIWFGSVFVLFLDKLHLSKTQIGLILALVPFAACLAPLIAPFTARIGYKRAFVLFYAARKAATFPLLLTPWVLATFGGQATFLFVAMVVTLFAISRAIEETAYYPWLQEFVPNAVRGKYSATSNILSGIAGFIAVGIAGFTLERTTGFAGFTILFGVGMLFGLVSVWASTFIPGGAPDPVAAAGRRDLWVAVRDQDFRRYLIGLALITMGTVPLASFLPLFMEEVVGLSEGNVVLLQMGTLLGTLASSYLWGWAADRYGSKPIMLTGLAMVVLLPLLWWLIPRGTAWTLLLALGVAFVQGMANLGWGIGAGRILFVSIVPAEKKMDYMALYFAWTGLVTGVSQFVGGRALDFSQGISGQFFFLTLDPYTPIFLAALIFPLLSVALLGAIRGDSPFSTIQFAGLFLRGNPFLAMSSLIRFYWARDERKVVQVTERMGEIRSRLAVDELLEALADPRFNVRYEAILSIARMPADARLIKALIEILQDDSPALSVIAAWALGKIGETSGEARVALHAALASSNYRSVQAHSVRALGTLRDQTVAPLLLNRLVVEQDEGLRVASASTLGKLRVNEAICPLLQLLRTSQDATMRMEVALALARIVGDENVFIQCFRQLHARRSTAIAQTVEQANRAWRNQALGNSDLQVRLTRVAELFAQEDLNRGATQLGEALVQLPLNAFGEATAPILDESAHQLVQNGATRPEYLLLALHLLLVRPPNVAFIGTASLDPTPGHTLP